MIEINGVQYVTSSEAARRLGIKVESLRKARRRDGERHPAVTFVGAQLLYRASDIERYGIERAQRKAGARNA